jgi:hypothetical protein
MRLVRWLKSRCAAVNVAIDRQAVLVDEMGDDGIAVADRLAVVDDLAGC